MAPPSSPGPGSAAWTETLAPALGYRGQGPRETHPPAHLGPARGRADKLQNSPELRKTGPSGGCPSPGCSAGVRGRGREGEEAAAARGAGAGRCCLGEGASLTSARAAISHAVRTLNLKGPSVPASEQAGFCLMHTVKGKRVTVIHLPRAQQSEGRPAFLLRATPSWPRAQEKAGTEHSALGQLHPDLWHLGAPGHQPGPKWQGRECLDPSHRYQSREEKATGSVWQCKRGERDAAPLGASEPARAPDGLHAGAGAARKACLPRGPACQPPRRSQVPQGRAWLPRSPVLQPLGRALPDEGVGVRALGQGRRRR